MARPQIMDGRQGLLIQTLDEHSPRCPKCYPTSFLGALAKQRKAIISSVISVCPSVCMVKFGSHWTDF
jgi:hypothetical protein